MLLLLIQVYQSYDFFDMNFMKWSKISIHDYKYIFNIIDYFSNIIFSFLTIDTKTTNVKQILIYYKVSHYFMSTIVYCDVESTFISKKIKKVINENDITFVIIFN